MTQVLAANNGITTTHNLYGRDLISQQTGNGEPMRLLLPDGLGSVRQEMAGSTLQTTTTTDPYGNMLAQTGPSGTIYGFTGEQEDSATGLLYLRARYYNPSLNQFQPRDSFSGYTELPTSQNGYNYVHGNPINFVDPSGNCIFGIDTIVCVLAAAGVAYGTGYTAYNHYFPQGTQPQNFNLGWWAGQMMGYKNVQEDISVMRDPCECPLKKGIAGVGAVTNAAMGIATIHGVGRAVASLPRMAQAWASSNPVPILKNIAQSQGATYHAASYVDDAGRVYANYRPLYTSDVYVNPVGKSNLDLVTSFMHEFVGHVGQGTGLAHRISAASTNAPKWLQTVTLPFGYFLNPVEVNAAASALGLGANNFGILLGNRVILDSSNVIKYGSDRGTNLWNSVSSEYNQGLDYLCKQMGY